MSDHALLSASGAHRWLHCTPSARLEETLPDSKSDYAAEGSLAHEIGELKLRKQLTEPMGPRTFANRLKKLKENPLFKDEMLHHTDTYMDYVSKIVHSYDSPPYVAVEKKLNYSDYAPEGFGTGDCIIIGGRKLYVIDLKYGQGVPVSADNNPQMMLYGLGAYLEYSFLYPVDEVVMVIVQPRLDNISEFVIPMQELLTWGESIKPIAAKAFAGEGEFLSGDHCQFCRAKAQCRARAENNLALETEYRMMKPPLISNEEVGQIIAKAQDLAKWAKAIEAYALAECLKGNNIPGWKAVHGRSTRAFDNQDEAFKVLTSNGFAEAMLYKREPLTLAATEELIGKAKFDELLSAHVVKPPGKPTLAPESDAKEAIKRLSAEDDFKTQTEPIEATA